MNICKSSNVPSHTVSVIDIVLLVTISKLQDFPLLCFNISDLLVFRVKCCFLEKTNSNEKPHCTLIRYYKYRRGIEWSLRTFIKINIPWLVDLFRSYVMRHSECPVCIRYPSIAVYISYNWEIGRAHV